MDVKLFTEFLKKDYQFDVLANTPSIKLCIEEGLKARDTGNDDLLDKTETAIYSIAYNHYLPEIEKFYKQLKINIDLSYPLDFEIERQARHLSSDFVDCMLDANIYSKQWLDRGKGDQVELTVLVCPIGLTSVMNFYKKLNYEVDVPLVLDHNINKFKKGHYSSIDKFTLQDIRNLEDADILDMIVTIT